MYIASLLVKEYIVIDESKVKECVSVHDKAHSYSGLRSQFYIQSNRCEKGAGARFPILSILRSEKVFRRLSIFLRNGVFISKHYDYQTIFFFN